jgi:predicted LPLAT superfamily acyltransferase
VAVSRDFYRSLFPERSKVFHWWCSFRQFQNFTSIFLDRFLFQIGKNLTFTFSGRQYAVEALRRGEGGIILMSHIGNWEIAAHQLRQGLPDMRLMLIMGRRAKEEIERLQKEDLMARGVRIVAVDEGGGSPFDLVEAVTFLKGGGFVSMTGDMQWHPHQRAIEVVFLGRRAWLPEAPHALALVSGVPLYIFFSTATDAGYHFNLSAPIYVRAADRRDRPEAVQRSAQAYADAMVNHLRTAPWEWYHFEPFLGPTAAQESPLK